MMPAEALASVVIALIFPTIFRRSRSTLREIAERFREIAAGLLLDGDDDREEAHLRHRHALKSRRAGLAQRPAERLGFDDGAELRLDRLGDFVATMRIQSLSGRPAFTPRTMTSMALGSSPGTFFCAACGGS